MKKILYSTVKESFESEGFTLLSKHYYNAKSKLKFICPNGHRHEITWDDWRSGGRCRYCSFEKTARGQRKDFGFIKNEFEKEDYKVLSKIYTNNRAKLEYICSKGHKHHMSWHDWNSGVRCPYCYTGRRHSYEFIKLQFEKFGYTLISKEYINSSQKLDFICPKGHVHKMSWGGFQQGNRCLYCSNSVKYEIEGVLDSFKKENYVLLTKEYLNHEQKLDYICPKGHKGSVSWIQWRRGNRCAKCHHDYVDEINRTPYSVVKEGFEKRGYVLLSTEYKSGSEKLDFICPVGHKGQTTWNIFSKGHKCFQCSVIDRYGPGTWCWRGGSSFEPYCEIWRDKEFKDFIKSRDNYNCLNPHCSKKYRSALSIHHINYNKKDCDPKNLITLCVSCNSRANIDCEWHTAWYQAIMHRRYGYRYEKQSTY